jgi:hypothetical protein
MGNSSGCAQKWTSVKPCRRVVRGVPDGLAIPQGLHTTMPCLLHFEDIFPQHRDAFTTSFDDTVAGSIRARRNTTR